MAEAADAKVYEASVLSGPGDALPTLIEGLPPPTPNVDVPLAPTIVCRMRISESGTVEEARVYRPRLELAVFEEAALAEVKTYRFAPAKKAGKPVAVWINWPVRFDNAAPSPETKIRMKGSDTIGGALGPALAMGFHAVRDDVEVEVEALGSNTAFLGLFDGSADIGASSRPVSKDELQRAKSLGIELSEFVIGYDGIAVVVHEDNPIGALSMEEVAKVFRGDITRWSELGWNERPIRVVARPSYSGTHAVFSQMVLDAEPGRGPYASSTDFVESSDEISAIVGRDPNAIAYVGLGWVGPKVKVISLQDQGEPVLPSEETIRDGRYPMFRPLAMYTRGTPQPVVADFLRFVVSPAGMALIRENGFVPETSISTIPSAPHRDDAGPRVERVFFGRDSDEPDEESRARILALGREVAQANMGVLVVGNADVGGSRTETMETSLQRAVTVADMLRQAGVVHVEVEAANGTRPISTNMTPAGRLANRRVDIFVTPVQPEDEEIAAANSPSPRG